MFILNSLDGRKTVKFISVERYKRFDVVHVQRMISESERKNQMRVEWKRWSQLMAIIYFVCHKVLFLIRWLRMPSTKCATIIRRTFILWPS